MRYRYLYQLVPCSEAARPERKLIHRAYTLARMFTASMAEHTKMLLGTAHKDASRACAAAHTQLVVLATHSCTHDSDRTAHVTLLPKVLASIHYHQLQSICQLQPEQTRLPSVHSSTRCCRWGCCKGARCSSHLLRLQCLNLQHRTGAQADTAATTAHAPLLSTGKQLCRICISHPQLRCSPHLAGPKNQAAASSRGS